MEKHRSNYTDIHESSTLLLDSTSVPPNIITANENEFNPNEQEEDPLEGINIQPWELEHAEAELAELRCPILPRAADADYSPSIPKKCSGKPKPVPADHNDQMLQLMISLAGKHNYKAQPMFQEYDRIYRAEAVVDRSTDLRFTTKPLIAKWIEQFTKKTEQAAAFDRHNPAADLLLRNAEPSILVTSVLAQTAPPVVPCPTAPQLPLENNQPAPNLQKPPNIWFLNAMKGDDLVQPNNNRNICKECNKHYLKSSTHPTRAFPGTQSSYRYCPVTYPDFDDWIARVLPQKHADRASIKKRPADFCTSCNGSKNDGFHVQADEGSKYFFCPKNKKDMSLEQWQTTWAPRFAKMEKANPKIAQAKQKQPPAT